MASAYTIEKENDGYRNVTCLFTGNVDAADSLAYTTLLNPVLLNNDPKQHTGMLRVDVVDYVIDDGLGIMLYWDSILGGADPTTLRFLTLYGRGHVDVGLTQGGFQNNVVAADRTGIIAFASTTPDATFPTYDFTIKLWCVKQDWTPAVALPR